ncbi:MarR family transcriptional regulator [Paenibacillus sp. HWE-109]|uniref:MarR family winged helix-turn-helix transcriptional regulator n=1 Tax=Paenibacillus sp. HWE-109 TaxID=1306526 RepID=UPI001EDDC4A6|nr:MarR family transcriptional regulator [Paenibacillus sp. HWE-109]UKS30511.1 MarR family transcriptional regulator [Paenibacillus sp. HWE-109]
MSTTVPSANIPSAGEVLQILIQTTHQLHHQFEAQLTALGIPSYLTGPRVRLLIVVSEAGRIKMSDLAAKLGIKARTVTQFVDSLEQEDLLRRVPDPDDRRATYLQLTELAPPLLSQARAAMQEASASVLGCLSPESRSQLRDLLLQLLNDHAETIPLHSK